MKWEKVENDRGKQGAFRDISLVHRKKNCEFTFHRQRDGKKKRGKGSVKKRSRLMNFVKKTSKRENAIENHALPPVHVQWKEENQYKNESLFSACGEKEKEVPYIFFHNFTACQWKLAAIRCQLIAIGYRGWLLVVFPKGGCIKHHYIKHHYFLCIIILRPQGATTTL